MAWREACGGGSAARITYEQEIVGTSRSIAGFSQEEGRHHDPPDRAPLRLSGIFRTADGSPADAPFPLRRALLWAFVGAAILAGLVLYFRHARELTPLIG
jgi:hypothetical protein